MRTTVGYRLVLLTIFLVVSCNIIHPANAEPATDIAKILLLFIATNISIGDPFSSCPTLPSSNFHVGLFALSIDIEQLVKSMTTEQEHGWLSRSECADSRIGRPLIYRTNENLRNKHKNAYEPIMFFLGPYNHGTPAAHARQVRKYKLLELFLDLNHEKTLSDYLEAMRQLEKPAKCCYANDFNLDRNYFVKMLLLDGCFVLMSLLGTEWYTQNQQESESSTGRQNISGHLVNSNSVLNEKVDQDVGKLETIQSDIVSEDIPPMNQLYSLDFWHDTLLLENQIPFFVISKLYELVLGESSTTTSNLTEKIVEFVEDSLNCYPKAIQKHNRPKEFFHLLHLCHLYFRPSIAAAQDHENQAKSSQERYHCAPA